MSNGIYDILGKLNRLQPKDNPVSMSAEPIYESVTPHGDIMEAVRNLEEKYYKSQTQPQQKQAQQSDDVRYQSDNPLVKGLLRRAYQEFPNSANDNEAIVALMAKDKQQEDQIDAQANEWMQQAKAKIDTQQDKMNDMAQVIIDQEKRFQDFNKEVASAKDLSVVDKAKAASEFAKVAKDTKAPSTDITAKGKDILSKAKAKVKAQEPKADTAEPEKAETPASTNTDSTDTKTDTWSSLRSVKGANLPQTDLKNQPSPDEIHQITPMSGSKKYARARKLFAVPKAAESIELAETLLDEQYNPVAEKNANALAQWAATIGDYNEKLDAAEETGQPKPPPPQMSVKLEFPDGAINLSKDTIDKMITVLSKMKVSQRQQFINVVLGDREQSNWFVQNMGSPRRPAAPPRPTLKKGQTSDMFDQPDPVQQKLPAGARDPYLDPHFENKEFLGKKDMITANTIAEAVRQVEEGKKLKDKAQFDDIAEKGDYYVTSKGNKVIKTATGVKHEKVHASDKEDDDLEESAKPDFLDVDKDGDKKEPFKKAVKDKEQVDEVAPPGAKAERMVKHIKKGYAKDGKLTAKEKGIAYATAWKVHNKGQVEETTEFGDTIKNSEGKMTKVKVTEGKDAIRNHPIYTTKEAWDHYSQELAEQEAMDQEVMTPETVDAEQELAEIASLAGLTYESKCSSCGCTDCKCQTLEEAATRKDFRQAADTIKDIEDLEKRKEHAIHYADFFKEQNSRFKRDMFLAACGVDVDECGMSAPATIVVGETNECPVCKEDPCMCDREREMGEGNEFTKARLDAIAQGKDSFTVAGKPYNVSGDTSDEKSQVESVNEDINVSITANGEQDALNLLRKLSGMAEVPQVTGIAIPMGDESSTCDTCGATPCGCEQAVEEERDIELANTPHEKTAPISAVTTDAGGGLGGVKKQYPAAANRGANPLEEQVEESLWSAYESMINDVKE